MLFSFYQTKLLKVIEIITPLNLVYLQTFFNLNNFDFINDNIVWTILSVLKNKNVEISKILVFQINKKPNFLKLDYDQKQYLVEKCIYYENLWLLKYFVSLWNINLAESNFNYVFDTKINENIIVYLLGNNFRLD